MQSDIIHESETKYARENIRVNDKSYPTKQFWSTWIQVWMIAYFAKSN